MKLLLTGANGFVGSHVLDLLRSQGHEVALLLRSTSNTRFIESHLRDVEIFYGSLDERPVLDEALRTVEAVIHCAGKTKAIRASEYDRVNCNGTRSLVTAANKFADTLRQFVLISSLAAAGPSEAGRPRRETDPLHPVSAYGKSKLAAENVVVEECKIPWTVLRPAAVYGPRDRDFLSAFRAVKNHLIPILGGGTQRFSLIYVRDAAEAICQSLGCAEAVGKIYNLAAEPSCTSLEMFDEIKAHFQVRALRLRIPSFVLYVLCMVHELTSRLTGRPNIMSRDKWAELSAPGWECDVQAIRDEIGFTASTPLSEGIRQTIAWHREQGSL